MFGVDEAGRGPVFGSLFIACVNAPVSALPEGINDSKKLSRRKIDKLATQLKEMQEVNYTVIEVPAEEIDNSGVSLSQLTIEKFADAIIRTSETQTGIADACLSNEQSFETKLLDFLPEDITVSGEHKADETHKIVGAASILAKDARETHIEELQAEFGEIGSGYPSDPTTKEFLQTYIEENNTLPPFARKSWATSQNALDNYSQSDLSGFNEN